MAQPSHLAPVSGHYATAGGRLAVCESAALSPYLTRHIKRFGNYELDLSAIAAPVTDDLTFEVEPPQEAGTIEADYNTLPEPNGD